MSRYFGQSINLKSGDLGAALLPLLVSFSLVHRGSAESIVWRLCLTAIETEKRDKHSVEPKPSHF